MNTRRLLLAALFVGALCAGGCTGYAEPPKGEEKPKAGEVPQAPPPHVKKTTEELLVGIWRLASRDGRPQPPISRVFAEFTKDGRFTLSVDEPPALLRTRMGTYLVKGHTIKLTAEASATREGETWEVTIKSLTKTELVLAAGPEKATQTSTYKREK